MSFSDLQGTATLYCFDRLYLFLLFNVDVGLLFSHCSFDFIYFPFLALCDYWFHCLPWLLISYSDHWSWSWSFGVRPQSHRPRGHWETICQPPVRKEIYVSPNWLESFCWQWTLSQRQCCTENLLVIALVISRLPRFPAFCIKISTCLRTAKHWVVLKLVWHNANKKWRN